MELSPLAVPSQRKIVYKISLCLKINQIVYKLPGHCNFFAQRALIASQREIDMNDIICQYELQVKSKLVHVLTKHVKQSKDFNFWVSQCR